MIKITESNCFIRIIKNNINKYNPKYFILEFSLRSFIKIKNISTKGKYKLNSRKLYSLLYYQSSMSKVYKTEESIQIRASGLFWDMNKIILV